MIAQLFSASCFKCSLRSRWRASLFLSVVTLLSLFIAVKNIRIAIASTLGRSTKLSELRRAVALDPANPELQHWLGLVYLYASQEPNPAEGLNHLRRATELNPYKPFYWSDLASACESIDDRACADGAFERALNLSPMTPRLHWLTAHYYLRTDRPETARLHFHRLLELSPNYAWPTFRLCLQAWGDPEVIWQKVLPDNPSLKVAYVNFLSAQGEADFAYRVWAQTVVQNGAHASPLPLALAEPYLDRLLDLGRNREAFSVWQDLQRLGIVEKPAAGDQDNLVFNGDFEQVPLNAGFDWRYREAPYPSLDFLDPAAYQGVRCLRLDFTVKRNEDYEPVYQIVPVVPHQEYLLMAYVRSENITSDSGPRLRVMDIVCPDCLNVSSETTVGTTLWHVVSLRFSTGAPTQFVRLSVWRPRSRTFPTEITGSFWLDAVSLKPVSSARETNIVKR